MTRCYLSAQSSLLIELVAADRIRRASQTQAPESHSLQQAGCSGGMGGYLPRHPSSPDTGRHSYFAPYLSEPVCLCVGVEGELLNVAFIQLCHVGASSALKGRKEGKERRKERKNSGLVPLPY